MGSLYNGGTIGASLEENPRPTGFDCLRIGLALAIIAWHTLLVCYGQTAEKSLWLGPTRPLIYLLVPCFFALSGFLVAGSMDRNDPATFAWYRAVRIFPALSVEVVLSAIFLGSLFSTLAFAEYITHPQFLSYFKNVLGLIHYRLPGVFQDHPDELVNVQLWTIPYELECYLLLLFVWALGVFRWPWLLAVFMVVGASLLIPYYYLTDNFDPIAHHPGRALVMGSFFAGVLIFKLRDRLPLSGSWAAVAFIVSWFALYTNGTELLAPLPIAYFTVYLGTRNPTLGALSILADYSYGVYLYGYPVQQTVYELMPWAREPLGNFLVSSVAAIILAAFSWHVIESPLMRQRKGIARRVTSLLDRIERLFPVRLWKKQGAAPVDNSVAGE